MGIKYQEGFSSKKKWFHIGIFFIVLAIVSFIFDILKFTPIYENKVMKHIINTNYWLSYSIIFALKIGWLIGIIVDDDFAIPSLTAGGILLFSLLCDIFQFTPLMRNQYMNQLVTLNTHASVMGMMIVKLFFVSITVS